MSVGVPHYKKIYDILLDEINRGEYTKETPIPSENELSSKYGVSRMTARKSVDMLVNQGYLERFKGKGTFITGSEGRKEEVISLSERLGYEEISVSNTVLKTEIRDIEDERILRLFSRSESIASFWVFERQRSVNDVPVILERGYIPLEFFGKFGEKEAGGSVIRLLERLGEMGRWVISAEPYFSESKKEAKKLSMKKNEMCLIIRSEIFFADGRAALYSESLQNIKLLPFRLKVRK